MDSASEALYEISRELNSSLDLDHVLDVLLDSSMRLLSAPMGYIVLVDRETSSRFLRCTRGIVQPGTRRSSIAEWVLDQRRPLVLLPSEHASVGEDGVTGASAAIGVPLDSADGTLGVVVIADDDRERRFGDDDVRLLATVANQGATAVANAERYAALQEAYLATVRSLAAAIDAKDAYTRGHSDRVARYAALVGWRIGLTPDEHLALELSSYLHDVGKIGVSERVLHKPGRLDEEEFAEMCEHPAIGASIIEPVAFPWDITPIVRHHHEHWDGSGYPGGLAGEQIPLLARVLSVADSHEAMISDRPYRKGMSQADALAELERCAGTQFDARIVTFFCDAVRDMDDTGNGGREGRSGRPSASSSAIN